MQASPQNTDPEYLFVLLGASNMARGYSALTQHLSKNISPTQFINALGPSRGYCARGSLLNFSYSPIGKCKVMKSAEDFAQQGGKMVVLLTDIGNDIMYGVSDQSVIECLDTLIESFRSWDAEVFITSIHVDISQDMGKLFFKLLKIIFYPKSQVTFDEADLAVKRLNHYIEEKSKKSEGVHLISGMKVYCGLDKIHFGLLKSHLAWSQIANKMLSALDVKPSRNIGLGSMAVSFCQNIKRLIASDMLKITKKSKEFF
jgi:hypothetical protein